MFLPHCLIRTVGRAAGALAGGCLLATTLPAADTGLDFFERRVRPVLIENCYKCHSHESEKGVKGGLYLDSKDGLLKGGDSGPALVPGDPERSLLIKAVRYVDENLQMPPKGKKLPAEQIDDLVAWVKMGAPDPRVATAADSKTVIAEKSQTHWAFRPVKMPALPAVKHKNKVRTPVDHFILARLEEKGLSLSPRADRRTLIRRATYDLIGLPPTPEEVEAFAKDPAPDAFERLVERLLASPHYGERWGRYWLDIARYADTKGYVFEEERRYPYSYTYRDWVIRAFNEDLPYDQFLVQQIAADRLALGEDKRPLAALGFLTLGRRFLNKQEDIIDDRLDVVFRGTMGLTISCARCHDHKFDPIPTRDYYSLYGVFASSHEPAEKPLLGEKSMPKEYSDYLAERKKRTEEREKYLADETDKLLAKVRAQVGDYLFVVHAARATNGNLDTLAREQKLRTPFANRLNDRYDKLRTEPLLAPWFAFAALSDTNFASAASTASAALAPRLTNAVLARHFPAEFAPTNLQQVAARYNELFAAVNKEWLDLVAATNAPPALPDTDKEALRAFLYDPGLFRVPSESLRGAFDTPVQQKLRALQRKIDELDATHPGAPPRAMALFDNDKPVQPRVFKRGNPAMPGDEVPRQFLEVVAGPQRKPFTEGSGRLEMARAIASRDNPLTARVFVNRVWMYHFAAPLVRTPSDFGLRSDPPTHPELLDYLAARFMDDGWSVKKLHRLIMLSSAYQQASDDDPRASRIDPANESLWRQNRRRLDLEAMRDTMLALSGRLDLTAGGRAVDITGEPSVPRRTVYGFVERQNLPGLFRTFDFASPDSTSPQRYNTTVPQQALFLMNSPFIVEQARAMLERPEIKRFAKGEDRVRALYRLVFQRPPEPDEVQAALRFVESQAQAAGEDPAAPRWEYGYGAVDDAGQRVARFTPLPHFNNYAWQGGPKLPDPKLDWVLLNAEGGHPGNRPDLAAIRRWRAPRDGVVRIAAELEHPSKEGNGVRARVVSSRHGLLGTWTAHHGKTPTRLDRVEVRRGDVLDFVTDDRGDIGFDSFLWAPVIRYVSEAGRAKDEAPAEWNARADFAGPQKEKPRRLSPWEKYAQVLLLANEVVFID
ncbi:MAG TPA: PSD1 and planctomycete cytochrome C domain-containing protein [Methylomirabilota bacterium]|nr:PSD1 and planctomycete cytochrome C domain-containing protein [Methylomirabilota bacterium]